MSKAKKKVTKKALRDAEVAAKKATRKVEAARKKNRNALLALDAAARAARQRHDELSREYALERGNLQREGMLGKCFTKKERMGPNSYYRVTEVHGAASFSQVDGVYLVVVEYRTEWGGGGINGWTISPKITTLDRLLDGAYREISEARFKSATKKARKALLCE